MKYDIKKIAASLEDGRVFYGMTKFLVVLCFVLSLLMLLVVIGILITIFTGNMDFDSDVIFDIVMSTLYGAFMGIFSVRLLIKNKNSEKVISAWLEDVVTIEDAKMTRLPQNYRIEVAFEYSGEEHRFYSEEGDFVKGHTKFYMRYCNSLNGRARVLYSPQFNKVLLLKKKYLKENQKFPL